MNAADWEQLNQLFEEAVDLTPGERQAFVDRKTTGNPELRLRLCGMLEHDGEAGRRISAVIGELASCAGIPNPWLHRRFGPYRTVREIGRGGMGVVFEAIRDDSEYQKTVALKVAPWGYDPAAFAERFRHERQILAALEHPHIARFLDGGTQDGTPYLVMEYVNGIRITDYCRDLDLPARIRLFQQVCEAVHYAHENLVVHRDLKPDNILVAAGQAKLLDFGISKLLGQPDTGLTSSGVRLWTPDYASPEQIRGRPVTVRSDVYALGLILYEILTGERAQDADLSSPVALEKSICESDPVLPSARAAKKGDRGRNRQLVGDLDTIVSKAIRKEPDQRYGSAAELTEDLRRYLENRPVHARTLSLGYRTQRFVRRHRVGVIAGALVVASVVAGGVSTLHQARRAERRFAQVRGLANAFVFDVHDRIETLPGATEARKAIVQTALKYLENLREEAAGDAPLLRELAAAYDKIGSVRGHPLLSNLGDSKGALESYGQAAELLQDSALREDHDARRLLASIYRNVGLVQRRQGNTRTALESYAKSRDMAERVLGHDPKDVKTLQLVAELESERGRTLLEFGDPAGAAIAADGAMQAATKLVAHDPGNVSHRMGLSLAYTALAAAQIAAGRIAAATESYRTSAEIREKLAAERPNDVSIQRNLMISYGGLGDLLGFRTGENLGDTNGALAAFRRATEIAERLSQSDPADRRAQFDLASAYLRLGSVALENKDEAAGLARLEEAQRLFSKLRAADPASTLFRYNLLVVERRIGEALIGSASRRNEGVSRLQHVVLEASALVDGPQGPGARLNRVLAQLKLAETGAQGGKLADTVARDIEQRPEVLKAPWNRAVVYGALGRIYLRAGRSQDASLWLLKSAGAWKVTQATGALDAKRRRELAAVQAALASINEQPRALMRSP